MRVRCPEDCRYKGLYASFCGFCMRQILGLDDINEEGGEKDGPKVEDACPEQAFGRGIRG